MRAEVLRTFEAPVSAPDGRGYVARICGRPLETGTWEGWIEFVPVGSARVLRSPRETTQPDHRNIDRWAQHLRRVYLEGALERTLRLEEPRRPPRVHPPEHPCFAGPAPSYYDRRPVAPDNVPLNPFLAYGRGEAVLREALERLSDSEIRRLVRAYALDTARGVRVEVLGRRDLIALVMVEIAKRMAP